MDESTGSDLLRLFLKRWWVLLLGIVVGGLMGFAALQVIQPTYSTSATQLIKGVPGSGTGANYLAAQFAVARAKSYPAFIHSSVVLDAVRADMGPQYTDARLRDQLSASNPTDTPLVQVTATAGTPKEAQDLANSASRHLARFITQIETVAGSTPVIVETAVQAGLPAQPSEPQPALVIGLGMTGGFAVATIVVLAMGYRSQRRQQAGSDADIEGQAQQGQPPAGTEDSAAERDPEAQPEAGAEQDAAEGGPEAEAGAAEEQGQDAAADGPQVERGRTTSRLVRQARES